MLTILNYITSVIFPFLKKIFGKFSFKDWILLILAILCIIFFFRMKYLSEKNLHNQLVFLDTITQYENKAGEMYQLQLTYITTINELKDMNNTLYTEVKNLKEHPLIITKTKTEFVIDTLYVESTGITEVTDTLSNNKQYHLNWAYNKEPEYFTLSGYTVVDNKVNDYNTVLTNMLVNSELTLNIIDNGKNLSVIVKSDNPYINVSGMQSVVIDPTTCPTIKKHFKLKRWGIGPSISFGVNLNLKWGFNLGIGIQYNVITF